MGQWIMFHANDNYKESCNPINHLFIYKNKLFKVWINMYIIFFILRTCQIKNIYLYVCMRVRILKTKKHLISNKCKLQASNVAKSVTSKFWLAYGIEKRGYSNPNMKQKQGGKEESRRKRNSSPLEALEQKMARHQWVQRQHCGQLPNGCCHHFSHLKEALPTPKSSPSSSQAPS